MNALAAALPRVLPLAVAWVHSQEAHILASGRALSDVESKLAVKVGVLHPGQVRIRVANQLPEPDHPELLAIGNQTGLLGLHTAGITFGHGIYIREGHATNEVISHELRHVHQYEAAGSIAAFLSVYLEQIATVGYERAPLELDAVLHQTGDL